MPTTLINVTFSAATIPDLESQINSELKYIDRWLKANKLSLPDGLKVDFKFYLNLSKSARACKVTSLL